MVADRGSLDEQYAKVLKESIDELELLIRRKSAALIVAERAISDARVLTRMHRLLLGQDDEDVARLCSEIEERYGH